MADKAQFVQGDMYAADISKATVMAMFLLTENLDKLMPKFLELRPGSRIVINGFGITGWTPDRTEKADGDCGSWCTAHLFYVPAKVGGTWQLSERPVHLKQRFQTFSGTLSTGKNRTPIAKAPRRRSGSASRSAGRPTSAGSTATL